MAYESLQSLADNSDLARYVLAVFDEDLKQ
jgi:hypothetical protein